MDINNLDNAYDIRQNIFYLSNHRLNNTCHRQLKCDSHTLQSYHVCPDKKHNGQYYNYTLEISDYSPIWLDRLLGEKKEFRYTIDLPLGNDLSNQITAFFTYLNHFTKESTIKALKNYKTICQVIQGNKIYFKGVHISCSWVVRFNIGAFYSKDYLTPHVDQNIVNAVLQFADNLFNELNTISIDINQLIRKTYDTPKDNWIETTGKLVFKIGKIMLAKYIGDITSGIFDGDSSDNGDFGYDFNNDGIIDFYVHTETSDNNITFQSSNQAKHDRNDAQAKLLELLDKMHIRLPMTYTDDLFGGFTYSSGKEVYNAINKANNNRSINYDEFTELMALLKKAWRHF